jgi:hypothetical protein
MHIMLFPACAGVGLSVSMHPTGLSPKSMVSAGQEGGLIIAVGCCCLARFVHDSGSTAAH